MILWYHAQLYQNHNSLSYFTFQRKTWSEIFALDVCFLKKQQMIYLQYPTLRETSVSMSFPEHAPCWTQKP